MIIMHLIYLLCFSLFRKVTGSHTHIFQHVTQISIEGYTFKQRKKKDCLPFGGETQL